MSLFSKEVKCLKCGHKYKKDPANLRVYCPKCGSYEGETVKIDGMKIKDIFGKQ